MCEFSVGSVTPNYDETKARIRSICSEAPKNNLHFLDRTSLLYKVSRFGHLAAMKIM